MAAQAQQAPVAFINELHNAASQADEWTEIVVVKDDLDLRGYYIGDNNGTTDSWQPKLQFDNVPLWQHLRAGTWIIISHSKTDQDCQAFVEDLDASDGLLKVCAKTSGSPYFSGGSGTTTLFLNGSGDFLHLIDPNGQMVQGIGYDPNPGGSVKGSPCYGGGTSYTNSSSAVSNKPPCGRFLFIQTNLDDGKSIGYVGGSQTDLVPTPGTIYTKPGATTNLLDTLPASSLGHGNTVANTLLIRTLRQPSWPGADTSCTIPLSSPGGGVQLRFPRIVDPYPQDQTLQYLVVGYAQKPLPNDPPPQDGIPYSRGSKVGSGIIQTITTFGQAGTEGVITISGISPTTYFRIYPFRYKITSAELAPDRGPAYNENQYWTLRPSIRITLSGPPTLCSKDSGQYLAQAPGEPPVLFSCTTPGVIVRQIGQTATIRFSAQLPANIQQIFLKATPAGNGPCLVADSQLIQISQPPKLSLSGPTSFCVGDTAFIQVTDTPLPDYIYYSVTQGGLGLIPYKNGVKVFSRANVSRNSSFILFAAPIGLGCRAQGSLDMVAKPALELRVVGDTVKKSDQDITLTLQGTPGPYTVSPRGLLQADSVTYVCRDTVDKTYTFRTIPLSGSSTPCVATAIYSVQILAPTPVKPLFIPNLVLKKGSASNQVFAVIGADTKRLQLFNRWGHKVLDASPYANDWAGEKGIYYYTLDLLLPSGQASTKKGWVEVTE
jgi:hypothetical protein